MPITELFNEAYEIRAMIAASLVGITCGILGCFIVLRNMALIGDALSHAILPGVVVGYVLAGYNILAFFSGAVIAGFITAILITWLQRNVKTKEDSAIGIIFTVMFALGIMGISIVNRKGVHLDMKDFLFGSILGVTNHDIWLTGLIALFVIFCVAIFFRYFFISTFQPTIARTLGISAGTMHYFLMLLLSFAIVASIQSVGVILVVAMLIIPASTAYLLTNKLRWMILYSAIIGLLSTNLGLIVAIYLNTTPGPAMTVMATILYGIALFVSPERGFIVRMVNKRKRMNKIWQEDILKHLARLHESKQVSIDTLNDVLHLPTKRLKRLLAKLESRKLVSYHDNQPSLTPDGMKTAYELIRAHRLWETYLVENLGLSADQIHEQAERFEHLLPEEFVDDLDKKLGYPITDPHGSPIPQKLTGGVKFLSGLQANQKAIITTEQPDQKIALQLWEMGITPNTPFTFKEIANDHVRIILNNETLDLTRSFASHVRIALIGK